MVAPFVHVDAFTDVAMRGNPAAVVVLDGERDDAWLQSVAAEMNLPETAFVRPVGGGGGAWSLRWCTPTVEVELCGHATLASAHALWELGRVPESEPIAFDTRSGRLVAARRGARIELELPALIVTPRDAPAAVLAALGVCADELAFAAHHPNGYGFLVVDDADRVRALQPDFAALARHPEPFLVTAPSDHAQYDFVSRFFAPSFGIDEDPVTGAAHCMLGPYWAAHLGKPVVTGFQASPRTGVVECEPRGDRVLLRGHAVTVLRGELLA
ncbi:MAG TPA: PhzF family phenazine biosynthesis protein [Acidimicrobiia bacterium]|jgi:PhzF family phenazine biosynthesis protein